MDRWHDEGTHSKSDVNIVLNVRTKRTDRQISDCKIKMRDFLVRKLTIHMKGSGVGYVQ